MVVKAGYRVIEWRAVEHLADLLQEAFAIQLSSTDKGVLFE